MKYLCLICADSSAMMEFMSPADTEKHFNEYREFTDSIRKSGQLVACNRLMPPATAITLRVRNGKVSTTDGPFAETKEHLGGYYLIEAKDQQEAVQIASRIPGARFGSVEIRAVAEDTQTLEALGLAAVHA